MAENALGKINELVAAHNKQQTTEFEANRNTAFAALENHYAATFAKRKHAYQKSDSKAFASALGVTITNQISQLAEAQGEISCYGA